MSDETELRKYLVTWRIDVEECESPLDAARAALMTQLDEKAIATVFDVQETDEQYEPFGTIYRVDLDKNLVTEVTDDE